MLGWYTSSGNLWCIPLSTIHGVTCFSEEEVYLSPNGKVFRSKRYEMFLQKEFKAKNVMQIIEGNVGKRSLEVINGPVNKHWVIFLISINSCVVCWNVNDYGFRIECTANAVSIGACGWQNVTLNWKLYSNKAQKDCFPCRDLIFKVNSNFLNNERSKKKYHDKVKVIVSNWWIILVAWRISKHSKSFSWKDGNSVLNKFQYFPE